MGPVANAIVELLEDSDLRATIVENGLNTVRGFEWRHAYSRIRDFVLDPRAHGLPDTANASLDDDFNPSPDQGNRKD
jgi:hypothetical protein